MSDHTPISFHMGPRVSSRSNNIQPWVTHHPLWPNTLAAEISKAAAGLLPINPSLVTIKCAMQRVAHEVRQRAAHHGARNADGELWWLLRARRAIQQGDPRSLDTAMQAVAHLSDFLNTDPGDLSKLHTRIEDLARRTLEEKMAEIENNKNLPEYARTQQQARLRRHPSRWSTFNPRVGLNGLRNDEGQHVDEPSACCSLISDFWGKVSAERSIDIDLARDFLRRWSRRILEAEWKLTPDEFNALLNKMSDSGVGPDGIPYSAWRFAPDDVRMMLYEHYTALIDGSNLDDIANYAWLALLPKGEHHEDLTNGIFPHGR